MKTISITSGKGGVGKTSIVANTAMSLAKFGYRVLILDGDLGMANVDIFYGIKPQFNIQHVLSGEKELHEIKVQLTPQITLLPGGSGIVDFNNINFFHRQALADSALLLANQFDFLLIDTSPGIGENVLYLNYISDQIVVVVTPDPSSFTDAYALIKVLHQSYKVNSFGIVCNMVQDNQEGLALYQKFNEVILKFLNVSTQFMGALPLDTSLRLANRQQRLIVRQDPNSPFAKGIDQFSLQIESLRGKKQLNGNWTQYWHQVVGQA